jgi:pyruvate-formate lyase-activating enzyme
VETLYAEELFHKVKKDDLYFERQVAAVTFGGGEPLLSCKEILHFKSYCPKELEDKHRNFLECARGIYERD